MDHASPSSRLRFTRREFVVTSLAAGFAAAAWPVSADTLVTTPATGLTAGDVKIPVAGGELPAYRAMPAEGTKHPIVLVVQEIFGVHEHIKDVCRRLAKRGHLAVAPELFARQGDVHAMTDAQEIVAKVVPAVPDAQVMSDLDATVTWAEKNGGDADQLAVTGFCWGGRIVWLYAAHSARLKAGVAWYGRLEGPKTALQPKQPIDVATTLQAPVLGLYGGADTGIPIKSVDTMQAILRAAGKPSDIVVYPGAPHAFFADYRASYRAEPAVDGWRRMQEWFTRYGAA